MNNLVIIVEMSLVESSSVVRIRSRDIWLLLIAFKDYIYRLIVVYVVT
jgi:hypothetical protein